MANRLTTFMSGCQAGIDTWAFKIYKINASASSIAKRRPTLARVGFVPARVFLWRVGRCQVELLDAHAVLPTEEAYTLDTTICYNGLRVTDERS